MPDDFQQSMSRSLNSIVRDVSQSIIGAQDLIVKSTAHAPSDNSLLNNLVFEKSGEGVYHCSFTGENAPAYARVVSSMLKGAKAPHVRRTA